MSIGPTIRELGVVGEEKEEVITQEEEVVTKETPEVPVISSEGPGRTYYYTVTDEEKLEMAMMVYAESNSEPFRGKVAVAAVILNRLVRDQTSIHEILTAPGQFTDSSYVTMELLEKYPDNYEAVEQALKGWDPTRELFPDGAHFFYAPNGVSEEAQRARDGVPTLTIGRHNFHDEFAK
ncbi:MAG: cell wall hydrolase [Clostridia bacterium]|nr:cell wall hydrolase [Clostridia bacterium]